MGKSSTSGGRGERLKGKLKENLRRRKQQARARSEGEKPADPKNGTKAGQDDGDDPRR